jgi:hypothetical protein
MDGGTRPMQAIDLEYIKKELHADVLEIRLSNRTLHVSINEEEGPPRNKLLFHSFLVEALSAMRIPTTYAIIDKFKGDKGRVPTRDPKEDIEKKQKHDVFRAICLWEGRGKIDHRDDDTLNPGIGPARIHQDYLDIANEQLQRDEKLTYVLSHMRDYNKAKIVFEAFMKRYHITGVERQARCHKGGPMGHTERDTYKYWRGVRSYIGQ